MPGRSDTRPQEVEQYYKDAIDHIQPVDECVMFGNDRGPTLERQAYSPFKVIILQSFSED